jgi:hypothetical protein
MTQWETLWTFSTENFSVLWQVTPDNDCDMSFDETGETAEKIANGTYTCFVSRIVVYYKGAEIGADYLGGSIYENPRDFRDHIGARGKYGSYFTDMVHSAISEARKSITQAQQIYIRVAQ